MISPKQMLLGHEKQDLRLRQGESLKEKSIPSVCDTVPSSYFTIFGHFQDHITAVLGECVRIDPVILIWDHVSPTKGLVNSRSIKNRVRVEQDTFLFIISYFNIQK